MLSFFFLNNSKAKLVMGWITRKQLKKDTIGFLDYESKRILSIYMIKQQTHVAFLTSTPSQYSYNLIK